LHFIGRWPDLSIAELLDILKITKQSLNRILRQLVEDGLVDSQIGQEDRRQRLLRLTVKGQALEQRLSEAQRDRMRHAYSEAGPEAVAGFRKVLEQMVDAEVREQVVSIVAQKSKVRK